MIYTRFGTPCEIVAQMDESAIVLKRLSVKVDVTKPLTGDNTPFIFTALEHLKADGGAKEIQAVLDRIRDTKPLPKDEADYMTDMLKDAAGEFVFLPAEDDIYRVLVKYSRDDIAVHLTSDESMAKGLYEQAKQTRGVKHIFLQRFDNGANDLDAKNPTFEFVTILACLGSEADLEAKRRHA